MTPNELAKALGGSFNGKWYNIPGPGHSSADRSLGFYFDALQPSGIGIFSFAGDDPVTCRNLVINKLSSLNGEAVPVIGQKAHETVDQSSAGTTKAFSVWQAAVGVVGTPVENYLATRGCVPASLACLTDVLRFHPTCPMGTEKVPAMVSVMRDLITAQPTGIHRTAIADDGSAKRTMRNGKPAKMMLGRAKGAAVMLSNSAPVMGIAEGIETALSAQKLFGMPMWACMSASGIAGFPIINGLIQLTIFADHDQVGIKAAMTCARRYQEQGIDAEIRYPDEAGDDWNSFSAQGDWLNADHD